MVQSTSWEANWFAASQEIPRISRNPKVHYRTHKRPPPVSIVGQPNPVHIPTSHLLEIRSNIISPSTPRSPQWSPSLRFPHQDPIHPLLLTHTCHMPSPSHSSRIYHPHNIGRGVHTYCTTRWNIVVFDCICNTQKFCQSWISDYHAYKSLLQESCNSGSLFVSGFGGRGWGKFSCRVTLRVYFQGLTLFGTC